MDWHKYSIQINPKYEEAAGELLLSLGIAGWEIQDGLFPSPAELGQMFVDVSPELWPDEMPASDLAVIHFYLRISGEAAQERKGPAADDSYTIHDPLFSPEEEAALLEKLKNRWEAAEERGILPPLLLSRDISREEDWRDSWKQFYKPILVQDILILPAWETLPPEHDLAAAGGKIKVLRLETGTAFGSGSHESTRLCLDVLSEWIKGGEKVLDIGCGSGILGLAALLKGAEKVMGTELDPACKAVVEKNLALNHMSKESFELWEGDVLDAAGSLPAEPYDLIFCNILAPVVTALAAPGAADRYARRGSVFITSGIYKEHRDSVREAFRNNPAWEIIEENTLGDWVSFVTRRK